MTQREYDVLELADLERRLRELENGRSRQAQPAPPERPYEASLRADIARLHARLEEE